MTTDIEKAIEAAAKEIKLVGDSRFEHELAEIITRHLSPSLKRFLLNGDCRKTSAITCET